MRIAIAAVLVLLAAQAWAQKWVEYASTAFSVRYYDPDTIRVHGHMRRVWVLWDFRAKSRDGESSAMRLEEFDCKEERYRSLAYRAISARMGNGDTYASTTFDPPTGWIFVAPQDSYAPLLKIICAMKK
jgi:hypothetical protein